MTNNAALIIQPLPDGSLPPAIAIPDPTHRFCYNTDPKDIYYIKSEGGHTCTICFYENKKNNSLLKTMMSADIGCLYQQISGYKIFFHCHDKWIVNLTKVHIINEHERRFILTDDTSIPISRSHKKEMKQYILFLHCRTIPKKT